jgi:hypothetical protein
MLESTYDNSAIYCNISYPYGFNTKLSTLEQIDSCEDKVGSLGSCSSSASTHHSNSLSPKMEINMAAASVDEVRSNFGSFDS